MAGKPALLAPMMDIIKAGSPHLLEEHFDKEIRKQLCAMPESYSLEALRSLSSVNWATVRAPTPYIMRRVNSLWNKWKQGLPPTDTFEASMEETRESGTKRGAVVPERPSGLDRVAPSIRRAPPQAPEGPANPWSRPLGLVAKAADAEAGRTAGAEQDAQPGPACSWAAVIRAKAAPAASDAALELRAAAGKGPRSKVVSVVAAPAKVVSVRKGGSAGADDAASQNSEHEQCREEGRPAKLSRRAYTLDQLRKLKHQCQGSSACDRCAALLRMVEKSAGEALKGFPRIQCSDWDDAASESSVLHLIPHDIEELEGEETLGVAPDSRAGGTGGEPSKFGSVPIGYLPLAGGTDAFSRCAGGVREGADPLIPRVLGDGLWGDGLSHMTPALAFAASPVPAAPPTGGWPLSGQSCCPLVPMSNILDTSPGPSPLLSRILAAEPTANP
ncbi:unnamed protein product [Pedinophyceae sp. YPF-701]|nr:unnamed protein product [Pedinophyceae sp. YPF-701]